jgi:hypothetical protein
MFNLADYQTVAERLEQFWKENPDGRIDTELIEAVGNRFIVKASVYRTEVDAHAWATGLAFEIISDRGVNSTSALENCESSAIGRALANCGYSPKGEPAKRASREEMAKVQNNQPKSFAEKLEAKITVEVPDDPWTVKAIDESAPAVDAIALVKESLGGKTQQDIPSCSHGEMIWKHGVSSKNKKPWGQFRCKMQASAGAPGVTFCEPIWYEISQSDGTWQPQKKWA